MSGVRAKRMGSWAGAAAVVSVRATTAAAKARGVRMGANPSGGGHLNSLPDRHREFKTDRRPGSPILTGRPTELAQTARWRVALASGRRQPAGVFKHQPADAGRSPKR